MVDARAQLMTGYSEFGQRIVDQIRLPFSHLPSPSKIAHEFHNLAERVKIPSPIKFANEHPFLTGLALLNIMGDTAVVATYLTNPEITTPAAAAVATVFTASSVFVGGITALSNIGRR